MDNALHEAAWLVFTDPRIAAKDGVSLDPADPLVSEIGKQIARTTGGPLSRKALSFISWYLRRMELMSHRHRDKIHYLTNKGKAMYQNHLTGDVHDLFIEAIQKIAREATLASKNKRKAMRLNRPAEASPPVQRPAKEIAIIIDGKTFGIPDCDQNREILRKILAPF